MNCLIKVMPKHLNWISVWNWNRSLKPDFGLSRTDTVDSFPESLRNEFETLSGLIGVNEFSSC